MDEWIVVDRSIGRSIDSAVVLLLLLTYDCIVVTDLIGEDYNNLQSPFDVPMISFINDRRRGGGGGEEGEEGEEGREKRRNEESISSLMNVNSMRRVKGNGNQD